MEEEERKEKERLGKRGKWGDGQVDKKMEKKEEVKKEESGGCKKGEDRDEEKKPGD